MQLIRSSAAALLLIGCAAAGWSASLVAIPYLASDVVWNVIRKRGIALNQLTPAYLPDAGADPVPMTNADMVTRSAIYDLRGGPVLFEADVPAHLEYWSVTVFAHNSDTLFVANDQRTGPGRFRLIVKRADQQRTAPADARVISPSERGFILVRAVTKDRNDPRDVIRTKEAVRREVVSVISSGT